MAGGEIMSEDLRKAAERMMHALAEGDTRAYSPKIKEAEIYLAHAIEHQQQEPVADKVIDDIVTELYFRFKDWSKRGFSADDVTWCEVKADVISLIDKHTHPQKVHRLTFDECFNIAGQYCTAYIEGEPEPYLFDERDIKDMCIAIMDACNIPKEGE